MRVPCDELHIPRVPTQDPFKLRSRQGSPGSSAPLFLSSRDPLSAKPLAKPLAAHLDAIVLFIVFEACLVQQGEDRQEFPNLRAASCPNVTLAAYSAGRGVTPSL
jgi:hypothetical protein